LATLNEEVRQVSIILLLLFILFIAVIIVMTFALSRSAALADRKMENNHSNRIVDYSTQSKQNVIEFTVSAD
jgi:signal transduction histidine kinase